MVLIRVRINFGISEFLRDWIKQQTGFVRQIEESPNHFTVEFDLTGPEATALKQAFLDRLIEQI